MNKFFNKFRDWIIIWIWFLLTVWVWTYAYENYFVKIEPNFTSWTELSSDTFNQVITNINELSKDLETANDTLATKSDAWSDITTEEWTANIPNQIWAVLNSETVVLSKWVYVWSLRYLRWDIRDIDSTTNNGFSIRATGEWVTSQAFLFIYDITDPISRSNIQRSFFFRVLNDNTEVTFTITSWDTVRRLQKNTVESAFPSRFNYFKISY